MPNWYPGEYRPAPQYPPHYPTMPAYLRIRDCIAPTLTSSYRDFWLRCRDLGLAEWLMTGISLRIKRSAVQDRPGLVTLAWMTPAEALEAQRGAWHQFNVDGSDWIHFDRVRFEQQVASNVTTTVKYWVAHEFGHSLGFGHGGDGIMDETPDHAAVNAEEIAAATAYWF